MDITSIVEMIDENYISLIKAKVALRNKLKSEHTEFINASKEIKKYETEKANLQAKLNVINESYFHLKYRYSISEKTVTKLLWDLDIPEVIHENFIKLGKQKTEMLDAISEVSEVIHKHTVIKITIENEYNKILKEQFSKLAPKRVYPTSVFEAPINYNGTFISKYDIALAHELDSLVNRLKNNKTWNRHGLAIKIVIKFSHQLGVGPELAIKILKEVHGKNIFDF